MEQTGKTCQGVLEDVDKAERCAEVVEIIDKISCKKTAQASTVAQILTVRQPQMWLMVLLAIRFA